MSDHPSPSVLLAALSVPVIPRLSQKFTVAYCGACCSVVSSTVTPVQSVAAHTARHTLASIGSHDSDCESVQEVVDSHQSNAVSQEIMSSSFVMNMFALPDSDDELVPPAYSTPISVTSKPRDILTMSPIDMLEAIVDGSLVLELPASYWLAHDGSGVLGIELDKHDAFVPRLPLCSPSHDLSAKGYAVYESQEAFSREICPSLVNTIKSLVAAGWPPVFVFVYDELWAYVAQYIQPLMSQVLGPSCV
jgi:hypothetical protein